MGKQSATGRLTPMMQRYQEVKAETPGTLLLFRMGDFYELFYDDAEIAAKVLGLTLTSRDKGSANPVPMAGFPFHALEGYLQKLIAQGHRVAICDQVEDPKTAKGMVRREVTRIVTPGTLTDEALLDPKTSNYLLAVAPHRSQIGLAWLELSTGQFQCLEIDAPTSSAAAEAATGSSAAQAILLDEVSRIDPAECILPESSLNHPVLGVLSVDDRWLITDRPAWSFAPAHSREVLLKHFQTRSLEGFDVSDDSAAAIAAGVLLEYVQETQRSALDHIARLQPYRRGTNLLIDETTRRSLELTRTQRDGKREGSLLSVLDETVTPMGARMLADWLANPLTDVVAIDRRLDAVEELVADSQLVRELRDQLDQAFDLQRLAARVATLRASPRDLGALARTLALLPPIKARLAGRQSDFLSVLEAQLDLCPDVRSEIEQTLVDEPPLSTSEAGMIREGFSGPLDELRDLASGGKRWIAEYQAREIERTGIPSLKIGFNKVFGYYIEVTAANRDKVPDDYTRKQTLKNQERFITPELKEYEEKVLRAEERALALEQELFSELRSKISHASARLQQAADVLARLDVITSFATLAIQRDYRRPIVDEAPVLEIHDGRHPVLDALLPSGQFVPNDIHLGPRTSDGNGETDSPQNEATIAIITGPNMAGKSTYIRQAALLTILAQIGSFLPARAARIGVADRIFARVGASDELGKGQSTFMVEMTETARILNAATSRSLVILDEIGRGTSTYDGISLAWAITEYLHDEVGCRTLFATHYHELTDLPDRLARATNWNVAVHEQEGDVIFLHKIVPGSADRSYGIHVARLAGVPDTVIRRADTILETLEADHQDEQGRSKIPQRQRAQRKQLTLFEVEEHPLLGEIRNMKLDELTPLAALQELHRMRSRLEGSSKS